MLRSLVGSEMCIRDRLKARGTTLGADDGIGIALALALLDSSEIEHGPLAVSYTHLTLPTIYSV